VARALVRDPAQVEGPPSAGLDPSLCQPRAAGRAHVGTQATQAAQLSIRRLFLAWVDSLEAVGAARASGGFWKCIHALLGQIGNFHATLKNCFVSISSHSPPFSEMVRRGKLSCGQGPAFPQADHGFATGSLLAEADPDPADETLGPLRGPGEGGVDEVPGHLDDDRGFRLDRAGMHWCAGIKCCRKKASGCSVDIWRRRVCISG